MLNLWLWNLWLGNLTNRYNLPLARHAANGYGGFIKILIWFTLSHNPRVMALIQEVKLGTMVYEIMHRTYGQWSHNRSDMFISARIFYRTNYNITIQSIQEKNIHKIVHSTSWVHHVTTIPQSRSQWTDRNSQSKTEYWSHL